MNKVIQIASLLVIIFCVFSCGEVSRKGIAGSQYREGEILVQFKPGVNDIQKQAAHRILGSQVMKRVKIEGIERIKLPGELSVEEAVRLYRENPAVEFAEPNYVVRAAFSPNDLRFPQQWYLFNTGQVLGGIAGAAGADIKAPGAWDLTKGDPAITVAVIDSGVDANHPDIAGNLVPGYDFVAHDNYPEDLNGHGTHVTGIIGALIDNAEGIAGIAGNCKIMPLRALDQDGEGTIADIIAAIDFAAERNVKIVNMSFAGPDFSQALYNSIKAYPHIIFIVAAGNQGTSATGGNSDATPLYPAGFDLPHIVSVAATDQRDNLARFSNYGKISVDLAAPGTHIVSTIPSFVTGVAFRGSYTVFYLAFGFEGINGAVSRRGVMERVVTASRISGTDMVLLIDDDGGDYYETYYRDALQSLGVGFDYYRIPPSGNGPNAETLKRYRLVIWFTGDEYRNTLTAIDQSNLRTYLESGGSLFITGQEIGFDIGKSEFYETYLHARYVTDDANGKVFRGASIFEGLSVDVSLASGDGASNQSFVDAVFPIGSATAFSIHYRDAYDPFEGTSMSSAVVSGVSALVASYYRDLSGMRLKGILLASVDDLSSLQGKVFTGGRVNAYRAITALLPPANLSAVSQTGGRVFLSWTDTSAAEEGFIIERKRAGDQFREIASVASGVTVYADGGLQSGTFAYRARGFIGQAYSLYSNEVSVVIQEGAKANGGGGCSLGYPANIQTAAANTTVLLTPLFIIWIMRRIRG